ncbi:MAG TPA: hypothetical protein VLT87_04865 [Thermoanaerobaculia bacterium]|nr:hypothetical protein [Thermoanaerobaculia bacterium]
MKEFLEAPVSESSRLIDFETTEVIQGIVPDRYILIVSGMKPYLNMDVSLIPRIYIRQPEYWGIEVVGTLKGIGLPVLAPYHVSLPLDGVIGTQGIEVIGANRSERFDVPPKTAVKPELSVGYYRAVQISGLVILSATGCLRRGGIRVFFEQKPIRIFPPEFDFCQDASGFGPEVLTPFCVLTSFQSDAPVERVVVHDRLGRHEVKVEQGELAG